MSNNISAVLRFEEEPDDLQEECPPPTSLITDYLSFRKIKQSLLSGLI